MIIDEESGLDADLIDRVMRALYQSKSQRREDITDEEWARWKNTFRVSMALLKDEAIDQIESGEWDE